MHRFRALPVLVGLVAAVLVPTTAATAAHVRPPKTTVTKLTTTPSTLTAAGGSLALVATVAVASSCTFTVKATRTAAPASGLPVTVPCGTGPVSTTVTVPADPCCTQESYRFTITVTGTRTRKSSVTVRVPPQTTIDCDPQGVEAEDLSGCDFSGQNLSHSFFEYADLSSTTDTDTNFSSSDFTGATLSEASAVGADFDDSDLSGAYLGEANLTSASFVNANLTDTNFQGANLTSATIDSDVSTVIWGDTTCPDGTNSNADGDTCTNNLTP
jgi:Pentapeptide repeats (8 copies)